MRKLTFQMLSESEQREFDTLVSEVREAGKLRSRTQTKTFEVFSYLGAFKWFYYAGKGEFKGLKVRNFVREMKGKYQCQEVDRDTFPFYGASIVDPFK